MKQKWGIALVCGLIWIGAVISLVAAIMALAMGGTLTSLGLSIGIPDLSAMFLPAAIFGIVFSCLYIVLGYFLWKHNTYAWWITFAIIFIGFILAIWAMILSMSLVGLTGIVLMGLELIMLTHKDSMAACKVKLMDWRGW